MGSNRDHHGIDALDKAERDLMGVFGLAKRLRRAWDELTSPEVEPEPARKPAAARARPQRTTVDAQIVEDSPTGVKIVVRQQDKPIKPDGR